MNPLVAQADAKLSAGQQLTAEEILAVLVGFDTVSSGSNLALIEWVEHYLDHYGVWHQRVQEKDEHGVEKSSLMARIGPEVKGGIVLSGHTDVVPVAGQQWTGGQGAQTAFTLSERGGNLYGRGAADMKGFIALALAQVPEFQAQELKRPVWFAFSHDEEIGCKCAEPMAKEFMQRAIEPQLIVVGEPTMMQVVDEHKGISSFKTEIKGKAGHSSKPEDGVNALYVANRLSNALEDINDAERATADPTGRFPSNYSTVHVGVLHAGTARNIIPDHAEMLWEVRPMPGRQVDDVLKPFRAKVAEIEKRYPGCTITTEPLGHVHGLKRQEGAPYVSLASYLAGSNAPTTAVNYGTEGGAMGEYGFPTVICGPGSIDQAHQPDEYVSRAQLQKGAEMMQRVGEVLSKDLWQGKTGGTSERTR